MLGTGDTECILGCMGDLVLEEEGRSYRGFSGVGYPAKTAYNGTEHGTTVVHGEGSNTSKNVNVGKYICDVDVEIVLPEYFEPH